jgi:hypothetical protein
MNITHRLLRATAFHPSVVLLACILFCLAAGGTGCQSNSHTSNPRLRKIDEMLGTQLPKGTSRERVTFFLSSRGFEQQYSADPRAVIGVVHHVDTETLQPATARVTFHFDAQDRLTTYEMQEASENPNRP